MTSATAAEPRPRHVSHCKRSVDSELGTTVLEETHGQTAELREPTEDEATGAVNWQDSVRQTGTTHDSAVKTGNIRANVST